MAEKPPAFQCYAKDYLTGTMTMTLAERGAYMTLLCYEWDADGIPDDPRARQRILGTSLRETEAVWPAIRAKLTQGADGLWRNERLEAERQSQRAWRDKSRLGGQRSAKIRAKGGVDLVGRVVEPSQPPNVNSSSSSSLDLDLSTKKDLNHQDLAGTTKKDRPIYECTAFAVFPWMDKDFQQRLDLAGREDFSLFDWYQTLHIELEAAGQSLPPTESFTYLVHRLYRDAKLPKASLTKNKAAHQTPTRIPWLEECERLHGHACDTGAAHLRRLAQEQEVP